MTMSSTSTAPPAPLTREEASGLLGQTMGLVAVTAGFFALGAYLGRNITGGWAIYAYVAALVVLLALNAAAARSEQFAITLLFVGRVPSDRKTNMPTKIQLPVEAELPSLAGAKGWINSEPLTATSLRGRPVLVEFWTFTCINWIRTLPHVRSWFEKYRDNGLVVLGVHTPEFEVERDVENVRRAAKQMGIDYPIAIDSDYTIWRAFDNRYWPALYFADADGQIRHHRFGEGEYEYSEIVIQTLLAAAGAVDVSRDLVSVNVPGIEAPASWDDLRSPETYIGYERAENLASPGGASRDRPSEYEAPSVLHLNHWALAGDWTVRRQAAALNAAGGRIAHRFHARDLHLVMAPALKDRPVRFRVLLDGQPPGAAHGVDTNEHGEGTVTEARLYQLIRQTAPVTEHTFEITFGDAGVHAYLFTFG